MQRPPQSGGAETSIVLSPPAKHRAGPTHQLGQAKIAATVQLPATHRFAHRRHRLITHCRRETDEQPPIASRANEISSAMAGGGLFLNSASLANKRRLSQASM